MKYSSLFSEIFIISVYDFEVSYFYQNYFEKYRKNKEMSSSVKNYSGHVVRLKLFRLKAEGGTHVLPPAKQERGTGLKLGLSIKFPGLIIWSSFWVSLSI